MASVILLILYVIFTSVCFGTSAKSAQISMECQPAVGVVGRTTKISCSFKTNFGADQKIIISAVSVTKRGETEPLFWFKDNTVYGDDRFKLLSKNDPSFLLSNTAVSDEGLYDYTIVTNRGIIEDGTFRISVTAALISMECQPAVGVVGQTTKISCPIKTNFGADQKIIISAVSVTKRGETEPLLWFKNNTVYGDDRFKLLSINDPSLLLSNTAVSDEGLYDYTVVTNRGIIEETFRISVTAKYNPPSISTWPVKILDGGPADLYCNASGGYPAGAIHWFDSTNTNWTKSTTLEITEREDKLLKMSSKLTVTNIDLSWAPFRCVILNSKFIKEEETMIHLTRIDGCSCCSSQKLCAIQFCTEDGEYGKNNNHHNT
ncbi:uncharacterized protein LOC118808140 [Colossoma macropomum]|uniref:uncharacterized protein LOC118808140 n=1 Tax=Colossoma macropomum TaxID=42526 RepID=UPI0018643877|nr:uncharacterized protein LOC118808140 [Colossoma macropomum]